MEINKLGKVEAEVGEVLDFEGTACEACPWRMCGLCASNSPEEFCYAVSCMGKERGDKKEERRSHGNK